MTETLPVRSARSSDLDAIDDIYRYYVEETPVTFDFTPRAREETLEWFAQFDERGPWRLLVAMRAEAVVGFAHSKRHRPKAGYDTSVETTVYVKHGAERQGVGTALYQALFEELEGLDLHRAFAGITLPNPGSIALHERFGFRHLGTFDEIGHKGDRYWSVAWYQKALPGGRTAKGS